MKTIKNKNIILGITGGISAYKSAEIASQLKKLEANIKVVMTRSARKFITPLTLSAISRNEVLTDKNYITYSGGQNSIKHIELIESADIIVIAPATANIIGKIANGIADDLLTTTIIAAKCPVLIAPAMNVNMWENPIVQENISKLTNYGYKFVGPDEGHLACGWIGKGRLANTDKIVETICNIIGTDYKQDLVNKTVLITAGRTEEPIDPIRFITNSSTGKMGYAIAQCAKERGAKVILISGPTFLSPPDNVELINVRTALEMRDAVLSRMDEADIIIKSAAVADYRPKNPSQQKIKKGSETLSIELEKTDDILKLISERKKDGMILVGFALETENFIPNAQKKLQEKKLDFILLNDANQPGAGPATDTNIVTIIDNKGNIEKLPLMTKYEIGNKILDKVVDILTN